MKNLFYFFAAAVMMTSCTLSEGDIPQPLEDAQVYEVYDGTSDLKEAGPEGGQGTHAEGYRPYPGSKKSTQEAAPDQFYAPDANLTPEEVQTELRRRRNTGTIIGSNPKIPACPEGNCGTINKGDKAPSLMKKQD